MCGNLENLSTETKEISLRTLDATAVCFSSPLKRLYVLLCFPVLPISFSFFSPRAIIITFTEITFTLMNFYQQSPWINLLSPPTPERWACSARQMGDSRFITLCKAISHMNSWNNNSTMFDTLMETRADGPSGVSWAGVTLDIITCFWAPSRANGNQICSVEW